MPLPYKARAVDDGATKLIACEALTERRYIFLSRGSLAQ